MISYNFIFKKFFLSLGLQLFIGFSSFLYQHLDKRISVGVLEMRRVEERYMYVIIYIQLM